MALTEYGLPEIRRRCPCEFGEIEPCSPNCTCRNHGQSGGCGRCCTYGSAEQKLDAARILVQREKWLLTLEQQLAAYREIADAVKADWRSFVTTRLAQFRDTAPMFGCDEAVELQALQLLELEQKVLNPKQYEANSRAALDEYSATLREFKKLGNLPIHLQLAPEEKFGELIFKVCQRVRERLGIDLASCPAKE